MRDSFWAVAAALGAGVSRGKGCAQTCTKEQEKETRSQNGDSAHGFLPQMEISRNFRFQLYLGGRLCAGPHTESRPLQFEIGNALDSLLSPPSGRRAVLHAGREVTSKCRFSESIQKTPLPWQKSVLTCCPGSNPSSKASLPAWRISLKVRGYDPFGLQHTGPGRGFKNWNPA